MLFTFSSYMLFFSNEHWTIQYTYIASVWEYYVKGNIWTWERRSNRKTEKISYWRALQFVFTVLKLLRMRTYYLLWFKINSKTMHTTPRKTRIYIHIPSRIRNHDPCVQVGNVLITSVTINYSTKLMCYIICCNRVHVKMLRQKLHPLIGWVFLLCKSFWHNKLLSH